MTWNELVKIATERGFRLYSHGANHDIYVNDKGERLIVERYGSQEIRPGLIIPYLSILHSFIPYTSNFIMNVQIEKQTDGSYIAYNTTGEKVQLIGTGDSVKEAKEDFFNTIEEVKQSYAELGDEMPPCLGEGVNFYFDLSSLFEYYSMLNVSALARYLGINDSLMRQYRKGGTPISGKQLEKIESGINRLGAELAALRLV